MLQETLAGFEVRCCASQRLHQARRGVDSCVQAAAAARVAGGRGILDSTANRDGFRVPRVYARRNFVDRRNILDSAKDGDGTFVLCHLIADAYGVNKRDTL